jgi:hypothetical protein
MAEGNSAITDIAALVALLYRADPGALCLAADISCRARRPTVPPDGIGLTDWAKAGRPGHGYGADAGEDKDGEGELQDSLRRVVLAPGGSYRVEGLVDSEGITTGWLQFVSDGARQWTVTGNRAIRIPSGSMLDSIWDLLAPSWLLAGFTLTLAGPAEAAGRPAWRAVGEARPVASVQRPWRGQGHQRFDHVEVLIDAELGILLRLDGSAAGKQLLLSDVQSLTASPVRAGDPAQFQLPPGTTEEAETPEGPGTVFDLSGPGWRAVKTAAGVAGDGLAFTIRHSSRSAPDAGTPPMPDPGPVPGTAAPVSDELVNLLYRTGLPPQRFAASARKWADGEQMIRSLGRLRAAAGPLSGLMGPEGIWNALASRPPADTFEETRLQLALPGQYRVDHIRGGREKAEAVGSDGERPWALYPNRVVTGQCWPLSHGWEAVVDPAWLLLPDWQLSADGEEEIGGRRGWRVWASSRPGRGTADITGSPAGGPLSSLMFSQVAAVIDAELGIILRLACLSDGQPALCWELTDVTATPADDGAFRRPELPGRRVVEDAGLLGYLDIPDPLRAAGKAGLAGMRLLSGLLDKGPGARPGNPRDVWDDASDS